MHAFVTGGSGFVGPNLIEQLLARGWTVTALHRPSSDTSLLKKLGAELTVGSIGDIDSLRAAMPENIDAVFHVAGNTSLWSQNDQQQDRDNIDGTANMVKVALEKKAGRFIQTSSVSAYGFHENRITESSPSTALVSKVNYLKSKYLAEEKVREGIKQGLDAVILNPCGIIGPYDQHNWSQLFTLVKDDNLPGIPPGSGSFCHVREVAAAHIAAYECGKTGENYLLAGTDAHFEELIHQIGAIISKPVNAKVMPPLILKIVAKVQNWISRYTKKEPDLTPEKVALITRRVVASCSKAVTELNYNDQVPLNDMLEDCYQWMKSEGRI